MSFIQNFNSIYEKKNFSAFSWLIQKDTSVIQSRVINTESVSVKIKFFVTYSQHIVSCLLFVHLFFIFCLLSPIFTTASYLLYSQHLLNEQKLKLKENILIIYKDTLYRNDSKMSTWKKVLEILCPTMPWKINVI